MSEEDITSLLRRDLASARAELSLVSAKVAYIESLLAGAKPQKRFTIAQYAIEVLTIAEKPMRNIEIARRAIAAGYPADIRDAAQRFSATITKDISIGKTFYRAGRGLVGLSSWKDGAP